MLATVLLPLFPALLAAQSTTSPATNTSAVTSTAGTGGTNNAAGTTSSNNAATASTAGTSDSGSSQSFPAPTISGATCGTTQSNFNACVTQIARDISRCGSTANTCLCQTYANLAACYHACPELSAQGTSYQQQSSQYCDLAGIKPNSTASPTSNSTTPASNTTSVSGTTSPASTSTTSTGSRNPATTNTTASTFAANSEASGIQTSVLGLFSAATAVCVLLFA